MAKQSGIDLEFRPLASSSHALGLVCEFVSRFPPFITYEYGPLVRSILFQLEMQTHLVGSIDNRIVAYLGWIRTTSEIAEKWLNDDGPLRSQPGSLDAVAVTILVTSDPSYTLPIIRKAKSLESGRSVYWKRYFITGKEPRKRVVRTRS